MTVKTELFRGDIYKNDKNAELRCGNAHGILLEEMRRLSEFCVSVRLQGRDASLTVRICPVPNCRGLYPSRYYLSLRFGVVI